MKKVFNLLCCSAIIAALATSCNTNQPEPDNGQNNNQDTTQTSTPAMFNFAVTDIAATTATVAVTPADNNILYYYDILAAELFTEYTDDQLAELLLEEMTETYETYKDEYLEYYGVTNFAEAYLSQGTDSWDFTGLTPSADYYAIAFGIDTATMTISAKLEKEPFSTTEFVPSDNQISFVQDADDKTLITITTTNNDPYIWTYFSTTQLEEDYAGDTQEAWTNYVEAIDMFGFLDYIISYGTETFYTTEQFYEAGDYLLLAAGYNGGQTTEIFTFSLTVTDDMIGTEDTDTYAVSRKVNAKSRPAHKFLKRLNK